MAVDAGPDDEPSITLHSSWSGIIRASLGLVILVAFAVLLLVSNGLRVVTVLIAFAALAAAFAVLFDMPIATRFDAERVERITPLRRRSLALDDIDRFSRMRRAVRRPGSSRASGVGLVALQGRKQILLVDRTEGFTEHETLRDIIGKEQAERLFFDLAPPMMNRTPTWVGRSKRWRPDDPDSYRS